MAGLARGSYVSVQQPNSIGDAMRQAMAEGLSYEEAARRVTAGMRRGPDGVKTFGAVTASGVPPGWRVAHDPGFDEVTNNIGRQLGMAPVEPKPWWLYRPTPSGRETAVGAFATREEAQAWAWDHENDPDYQPRSRTVLDRLANPAAVDIYNPVAFRAAADEMVKVGKYPDRLAAMKAILLAQSDGPEAA